MLKIKSKYLILLKQILLKHTFLIGILIFFAILNIFKIGCIIKWLTGISCPGCGMTRATLALLRLDFKMAFYYHPLFFIIIPSILFIVHSPKPLFHNKIYENIFYIIIILIILITYIVRLFILKSDIISIDFSNSFIVLFYKRIKEMIL